MTPPPAQAVWKYPLRDYVEKIKVPGSPQILRVGFQNENLFVWILVEPDQPMTEITLEIYGTGHKIAPRRGRTHIGTAVSNLLAWHVFHLKPKA